MNVGLAAAKLPIGRTAILGRLASVNTLISKAASRRPISKSMRSPALPTRPFSRDVHPVDLPQRRSKYKATHNAAPTTYNNQVNEMA